MDDREFLSPDTSLGTCLFNIKFELNGCGTDCKNQNTLKHLEFPQNGWRLKDPTHPITSLPSKSWRRVTQRFRQLFVENGFGFEYSVCDRQWFAKDLRAIDAGIASFLALHFSDGNTAESKLCVNCFKFC